MLTLSGLGGDPRVGLGKAMVRSGPARAELGGVAGVTLVGEDQWQVGGAAGLGRPIQDQEAGWWIDAYALDDATASDRGNAPAAGTAGRPRNLDRKALGG